MVLNTIIAIILGYLLGSIPFAYIAGRLKKGVDIRQVGGGNMGALNAFREIGVTAGLIVLIADIGKGLLAVLIGRWLGLSLMWLFAVGFAAIVGHSWPIFLRFRGGKGGATILGVLLALSPREFAISAAIIILLIVTTNNVRLAMAVGLTLLPLIVWLFHGSFLLIIYPIALLLFLGLRLLPGLKKDLSQSDSLVFDRSYHFWQTKKKHG